MLAAAQPHRKPLQPKNANELLTPNQNPKPKTKPNWSLVLDNSNKENYDCALPVGSPFDASLAEELSAIREKLERLRIDKEETEKMLRERDLMLDFKFKELLQSGQMQKQLEIEVDRLYRLNQIRLSSQRISTLRSLRDKESEHNTHPNKIKKDEENYESPSQSSNSAQETEI